MKVPREKKIEKVQRMTTMGKDDADAIFATTMILMEHRSAQHLL